MISRRDGRCIASSKDYLDCIMEQFSELDDITYRAMMGEYIFYYQGEVFGGWDDDRFLVKPTKATKAVILDVNLELPLYDTDPLNAIDCHCFWKAVHAIQRVCEENSVNT